MIAATSITPLSTFPLDSPLGVPEIRNAQPSGGTRSLLPAPANLAGTEALYFLQLQCRSVDRRSAAENIQHAQSSRQREFREWKNELRKALEQLHEGGFWKHVGCVARVAAVVASIAAAVGTCGAATPVAALAIAGATLSSASFIQSEFHVLESMGIDASVAGWVGGGMAVGGALCSGGAGLLGTSSNALSQSDETLGVAVRIAKAGSGLSSALSGYATFQQQSAVSEAERHFADAEAARLAIAAFDRLLTRLLSALDGSERSNSRTLGHIREAGQIHAQTLILAAGKA